MNAPDRQEMLDALDAVPREDAENARSLANLAGIRAERAEADYRKAEGAAIYWKREAERAEAERDAARAENARLLEALRPFAEFLDALDVHGGYDPPDGWVVRIASDPPVTLHIDALHRARAALGHVPDRCTSPNGDCACTWR